VALGSECPDHWRHHYDDTLAAGRRLCEERLARLLCEDAAECIREMDAWGVGWARKQGRITQAFAPGHDRARCVYVDFLNTGPAVSKTLRGVINRVPAIRKTGDLLVIDLAREENEIAGAVALHLPTGTPVTIGAKATVLATGGLTRLYGRNSASANMSGDGYALALRAGAALVDMEFVQFFPIGHLAPRLIGMDPIMWDPFRYKLGGRLLNSEGEEFTARYGVSEDGRYIATRDVATYAIIKEVEAGRGSPHGGAFLSFQHCSASALREAFGPVIDRLAKNGIDLTKMPVEVAPIAHYHMGGVIADERMQTSVPGLLVAGEVVGGANGANRLSGNAITEALVFGRRAGRSAGECARRARAHAPCKNGGREALDLLASATDRPDVNTAAMVQQLQTIMARDVGPFRTRERIERALRQIAGLMQMLGERPFGRAVPFDVSLLEWFDLRNMLLVARSVAMTALARCESRGAHQREDFPEMLPQWQHNQIVHLRENRLEISTARAAAAAAQ
jgi:succinate dehydrogenase/fumarate reductase flavoprotein subunit